MRRTWLYLTGALVLALHGLSGCDDEAVVPASPGVPVTLSDTAKESVAVSPTGGDIADLPVARKAWSPPTIDDIPADTPVEIRSLIKQTFSPNPLHRAAAARELGKLRDNAHLVLPFLIRLLGDETSNARGDDSPDTATSAAVGELGESAVPYLVAALADGNPRRRASVMFELYILGDPRAIEPALRHIHDEDHDVRRWALFTLRKMPDNRAVEDLVAIARDASDHDERVTALRALEKTQDNRAVEPIIRLLDDSEVVVVVVETLAAIKDTRATVAMIRLVQDKRREALLRAYVAEIVGATGGFRAHGPLLSVLNDQEDDPDVRAAVAEALGSLGNIEAFDSLETLARDDADDYLTLHAIRGIGKLGDARCVPLLIELFDKKPTLDRDDRQQPRFAADIAKALAQSLVNSDNPAAIDRVAAALDSRDPGIYHEDAVYALGASSNPRAYMRAIAALEDKDPNVRGVAVSLFARGIPTGVLEDDLTHYVPPGVSQALKDSRILKPLMALIENRDEKKFIRKLATIALSKTNVPKAIEFLKRIEGESTKE